MNLKRVKVIAVINIFIISFLAHFMYELFPNILISFFFPINESIWEHMKILFTSTLIYGIFDYMLLKVNEVKFNNFAWQLACTSILSIVLFLIIYLPFYYFLGEILPITLIIMLVTYSICQAISFKILRAKKYDYLCYLGIALIIFMYVGFIIFTYNPPHNWLFYDNLNGYYGIK